MRLYAVVKSERASKGQGGNSEIFVEFFVGSGKESLPVARVYLRPTKGEDYTLDLHTINESKRFVITAYDLERIRIAGEVIEEQKAKGKRAKGDIEF